MRSLQPHRHRYSQGQEMLQQARAEHTAAQKQHKAELDGLTNAIANAKRQHTKLHYRRADSVPELGAAVAHLRGAVKGAEQRLLERAVFG